MPLLSSLSAYPLQSLPIQHNSKAHTDYIKTDPFTPHPRSSYSCSRLPIPISVMSQESLTWTSFLALNEGCCISHSRISRARESEKTREIQKQCTSGGYRLRQEGRSFTKEKNTASKYAKNSLNTEGPSNVHVVD